MRGPAHRRSVGSLRPRDVPAGTASLSDASADYDWSWPQRIDRDAIDAALRLEFLDGAQNVVLVAPQGLGKTMIAKNICHEAVLAGHSVLFITAAQLLLDLAGQDSARGLERRLRH